MLLLSKKQRAIKRLEDSQIYLDDKKNLIELDFKRIEVIASANDQYVAEYESIKEQYEKLLIQDYQQLSDRKDTLITRFHSNKLNKDIYEFTKQYEKDVSNYHKKTLELYERCERIFEPGIPLREKGVQLKEIYREILDDLDYYHASLTLCLDAFKAFLDSIEVQFDQLENLLNTAYYEKAKEVLQNINDDLMLVHGRISKIAEYNTIVTKLLPERLEELLNKDVQLTFSGYFISHLKIKELVATIYNMLDIIKGNFAKLKFGGFEEQYAEIEEKLTLLTDALENEISCKINFDEHYKEVLHQAQIVEADFIKVKRQYNEAKEYYHMDDIIEQRFVKFQNAAAHLSDKKREFEGFIFSNSRNPYSFMVQKMNLIQLENQEIEGEIQFFNQYFIDMKQYAEETYLKEHELTCQLIQTVGFVRQNNLDIILDFYQNEIQAAFSSLQKIREELKLKPIRISYIKEQFNSIQGNVLDLIQLIKQREQEANLAAQSIIYANQLRSEFNQVDQLLKEAESNYAQQNYKETAEMVIQILKEYHPVAYQMLGGK